LPGVVLQAPSVVCSGDPLRPAPDVLHDHHVVAHAVRHLVYLVDDDPGIATAAQDPDLAPLWQVMRDAADEMPTDRHDRAHLAACHAVRATSTDPDADLAAGRVADPDGGRNRGSRRSASRDLDLS
jgi:hypothetical protein